MQKEKSAVDRRKLSDLVPDKRNANKGTKRGAEAIENSLRNYGAGRSILIDKAGRIIAGNKTAENAARAGFKDVLVVKTDGKSIIAVQRTDLDLTKDKGAKELAIADNRAGQLSLEWDPEVLEGLSGEIDLSGLFDADELQRLVGGSPASASDDEAPKKPKKPTTAPGDMYEMGGHRLLCGDALNLDQVGRLMKGKKANAVWTDPPYNVDLGISSVAEAKRRKRRTDGLGVMNDKMADADFRNFLRDAFASMFAAAADGAVIYVAHADSHGYEFRGAMTDAAWTVKQCLIWLKNSLVMGRQDYQWIHEPILYGWKPGSAHKWYSDRSQTTVLEFPRPKRSLEHPTMKPVALIEYCLSNSSKVGDLVLDLFGGSGSTLMACENTGRKARLMELDPGYCDVIVARWEQATGRKAALVS